MRFRNDARDIEADAHPGEAVSTACPADEWMPELRDLIGGDPDPPVGDRNLRRSALSHEPDSDRSARGRVLHRVSDELHEQLFDARLVAVRGDAFRSLDREDMAPLFERRIAVALHDFAAKAAEVTRDSLHAQRPLTRPRRRQDL